MIMHEGVGGGEEWRERQRWAKGKKNLRPGSKREVNEDVKYEAQT